ncbi:unnamed protein product [Discosporangium mesarthrocarpum]
MSLPRFHLVAVWLWSCCQSVVAWGPQPSIQALNNNGMKNWGMGTLQSGATVAVWERDLELARHFHRCLNFPQVRLLCQKVISASDDWETQEHAHLRLALSEQRGKKFAEARKAFQHGTAICPSSDKLLMAWALFESKIRDCERSKKVALALIRRAIALNPDRHSSVLKWKIFSEDTSCRATTADVTGSNTFGFADELGTDSRRIVAAGVTSSGETSVYRGDDQCEKLSKRLLDLAERIFSVHSDRNSMDALHDTESLVAVANEIEVRGREAAPSAPSAQISGGWRLAFTNSPACEYALAAAQGGSGAAEELTPCFDLFHRLLEPIREISPMHSKARVPFRCEVQLIPKGIGNKQAQPSPLQGDTRDEGGHFPPPTPAMPVLQAFQGFANICGGFLCQHLAPARREDASKRSSKGGSRNSIPQVPGTPPIPLLLSGVGDVAKGKGLCLETVVDQKLTFVGERVRIGRSRGGHLFVYERCTWPPVVS